ncbi:MAG: amidohydrolase [Planctomycetaceae bacterium]|nr:amidohydrolase [Planctomycetaceae bacterium]
MSTFRFAVSILVVVYVSMAVASQATACEEPRADFLLVDAQIHTVDAQKPYATALAIRGDRVLAIGTPEEMRAFVGPDTKTWSAGGNWVTPGFIEGHGHFVGLGQSLQMLDLSTAKSWDDIIAQVQAATAQAKPGEWIVGRGWHQEKWQSPPHDQVDGYPRHDRLSEISPQNPVLLTHASGHATFANDYAMKLAGVTGATPDPPGGELLRFADPGTGVLQPTGVFRETASALVQRTYDRAQQRASAEAKQERWLDAIQRASAACLENGITTFQDAGSSIETIDQLRLIAEERKLPIRLWVMVLDTNDQLDRHLSRVRVESSQSPFMVVRAIKRSIDGALGPHGAWLLNPYEDLSTSVGLNTSTIASIEETARLAIRENYQLCVHAIGDRANREVLDLYERAMVDSSSDSAENGDWKRQLRARRWRIEHAQHLSPADIPRFADLGVIPSMQGIHCPSDAVYVLQRLGYRRAAEGAYMWRTLIDSGARIINGTDAPVERISPAANFYASVTRRMPGGTEFFAEQAMTRQEALLSYTLWAAEGAFEEDVKGSLTPGKYADLTIWSADLLNCPVDAIPSAKVLGTVVGGRIAFEASGFKLTSETK